MMQMIPIALFLLIQSAQFIDPSEIDKREPGRIFVSWVGDPPPKFVETREAWFGLKRSAVFKCKDARFPQVKYQEDGFERETIACPDVFYEYQVRPGTEAFWVEFMRTQYGVFVASWTARYQVAGHGARLTDLRQDDNIVIGEAAIPAFAPGLDIRKRPGGINAGRDEACVEPLSDSKFRVRTNRAGSALLEHRTSHDLLVGYVNDYFKGKGHTSLVLDHEQRLVFKVDSIKGEVLRADADSSLWEEIELEIVFVDPTRTSALESKCIQIYTTVIGKYAAGTPNVPPAGSFYPMEPKYSKEEQNYAGEFTADLKRYLTSAKDDHD